MRFLAATLHALPVIAQVGTAPDSRPGLQHIKPSAQLRKSIQVVAESTVRYDPWKRSNIRDRVIARKILTITQANIHYGEQSVVLIRKTFMRIRHGLLRIAHEMAQLSRYRPETARLPKQPLQHLESPGDILRQKLPGLFRQVHQYRAALEDRNAGFMINDSGHAIVRADLEKLGVELSAAANIHRNRRVVERTLLEHDRNFAAVRCRPIVQINQSNALMPI